MARMLSILAMLISLAATTLAAEVPCSKDAPRKAAEQVLALQARLLAVKAEGWGSDDLSASARADIHRLKAVLNLTVDAAMACEHDPRGDVGGFAKGLSERLNDLLQIRRQKARRTYDWDKVPKEVDGVYGSDLAVKIRTLLKQPYIVGVQVRFDVDCGDDNVLLIYEWKQDSWQRSLLWQAPDYDEVDGAFGDFFQYRLIPNGGQAGWALAVAHGHPWCSSNLSEFDLDVLEPSGGPAPPKVLFHKEQTYRRFDTDPRMNPTPNGFDLRLSIEVSDPAIISGIGIYRYRVAGGHVERVQPIAMNGRDFVEGWLQAPWSDAAGWSILLQSSELEREHRRIQLIAGLYDEKADALGSLSYGPVLRCSDSRVHFQVELDAEKWVHEDEVPISTTYFQIEQGKNSFTMLSASDKPDPRCGGGDLMGTR